VRSSLGDSWSRRQGRRASRIAFALALPWLLACAPRVRPITGVPYPQRLPETTLAEGHARLVFRWEYSDPLFAARGEGVARIAPPDSVRLDFFSDGDLGGGYAILIANELSTPAKADAVRYLPPVPLLWAALGRLQVTGSDTLALVSNDTLRADIGRPVEWRAAFAGGSLVALERLAGNRRRESVTRDSTKISYRNFGSRRRLTLTHLRRIADPPYDEAIWHR